MKLEERQGNKENSRRKQENTDPPTSALPTMIDPAALPPTTTPAHARTPQCCLESLPFVMIFDASVNYKPLSRIPC